VALIATQSMPSVTPADLTYTAVSASDTFAVAAGSRAFLVVKNGGASSDTVAVVTPGTVGPGLAIGDLSFAVAAGATKFISIDPAVFASDGIVTVTHTYTTSVTAGMVLV